MRSFLSNFFSLFLFWGRSVFCVVIQCLTLIVVRTSFRVIFFCLMKHPKRISQITRQFEELVSVQITRHGVILEGVQGIIVFGFAHLNIQTPVSQIRLRDACCLSQFFQIVRHVFYLFLISPFFNFITWT